MVNLPHGREIQGSVGVRSLLLRSILRLVRLNGLSVNDLHHTHTFAVHAYDLLAAFMQYFSRLLACIFFLHEMLTSKIFKS